MAITTLDGLVAGLLPPVQFYKVTGTMKAAGLSHSLFYSAGVPGAAAASSAGIAGEALTSYAGQIPFPGAVGGKSVYACRMEAVHTSSLGNLALLDRLWHNSGYSVTSTSSQTVNSVALPARDNNASTNGEGVMVAMEVSATLGAGTPTITVTYTNSDGTTGRTGTIGPITTTSVQGTWYPMQLQAGDKGVRSIQSIQSSATMTSGSVSFVMYREITSMPLPAANFGIDRDAIALGMPKMHDSSVPFLVALATNTTTTTIDGAVGLAQG